MYLLWTWHMHVLWPSYMHVLWAWYMYHGPRPCLYCPRPCSSVSVYRRLGASVFPRRGLGLGVSPLGRLGVSSARRGLGSAPRCFLGSAPRRLDAAVPRCLHVSSVLYYLVRCIYARLYATFCLQGEVSQLPPSSTSQMTRGGTSPRYEFRLRLFNCRPPSPAHSLDFNVQARWRGGAYLKRVP